MEKEKVRKTACRECGVVMQLPFHLSVSQYRCPRCNALIYRRGQPFTHIIVMAVTTLILFVPLTFLPILDLNIMSFEAHATLFEAFWMVYEDGYYFIALLSMFTGLILPVVTMLLLLLMLIPLQNGYRPERVSLYYRVYEKMLDWGMVEVYLISIIVSIVKLHKMGTLHIGLGFYDFIFFFLTFYITTVWFNPDDIWTTDAVEE